MSNKGTVLYCIVLVGVVSASWITDHSLGVQLSVVAMALCCLLPAAASSEDCAGSVSTYAARRHFNTGKYPLQPYSQQHFFLQIELSKVQQFPLKIQNLHRCNMNARKHKYFVSGFYLHKNITKTKMWCYASNYSCLASDIHPCTTALRTSVVVPPAQHNTAQQQPDPAPAPAPVFPVSPLPSSGPNMFIIAAVWPHVTMPSPHTSQAQMRYKCGWMEDVAGRSWAAPVAS